MMTLEKAFHFALYYGVTLAFFTALVAFDRGMDAVRWPRNTVKSAAINMCFLFFNMSIAPATYVLTSYAQSGYAYIGMPSIDTSVWTDVPLALVILVGIVLGDFSNYWVHRLLHTRYFWPIHAVHHSDTHLNNTTSFRIHFMESWAMALSYVLFASWAGLPPGEVAAASLLLTLYNRYVHLDVDWSHGKLGKLLASPRFHQWHHVDKPDSYNTNYANIFVSLDVVFGTYRVPGKCDGNFGVAGMPSHDMLALLVWPYRQWISLCLSGARDRRRIPSDV
jgi:sterol desaturase/sphingolipid hydroxylase (fatty acid hydroxylase superfamily)